MRSMRLPAAAVAGAALIATAAAVPMATGTAAEPAPKTLKTTGLDILLTNDDGWDALGIEAVHDKLTAAGHSVTMAAPSGNRSGFSAKVTLGSSGVPVVQQAPNKWSVDDSPVTSMIFGLEHLYKKQGKLPDLVISGTNVGPNVGYDTNFSGTVGAAITAAGLYDLPAIAVSTDLSKTVFPPDETTGSYDETADLIVDMISKGIPDLPKGEVININYPDLNEELTAPKGIKYVSNSQNSLLTFNFIDRHDGMFAIQPGAGPDASESPANSDIRELAAGYVTVGVMKSDRSVPASDAPAVTALLKKLPGFQAPPVVTPPVTTPSKATTQKLPKKVLRGTSQWIRTTASDGTTLTFTWKAKSKSARSTKATAKATSGLAKFRAPKKTGKYKVTVTVGGKKIRTGQVTVR